MIRAPVLLVAFNRPELTALALASIREAQPSVLYFAVDGPRSDRPDDVAKCRAVRELADEIDWPCQVHRRFPETNLGCGPAVSSAISWVFGHETEAIIVEDDCVADPTFFTFCDDLLERYADDGRVWHIAGSNLAAPSSAFSGASYAFASFPVVWGWATWRRAWQHYDRSMSTWPAFRDQGLVDGLHGSASWRRHVRKEWDHIHAGNGTWDHQWQFTVISNHALAAYPETNLVTNVGFGRTATQTQLVADTMIAGRLSEIPRGELRQPLRHPALVAEHPSLELHLQRELLRATGAAVTLLRRILPSARARQALRRIILREGRARRLTHG